MSSSPTLYVAHEGHSGSFLKWLEQLGLAEFLKTYSLPALIEWGWVVPQYRVVFPRKFFAQWEYYPSFPWKPTPDLVDFAQLWDYSWWIDKTDEDLWFLDPLFNEGSSANKLLRKYAYLPSISALPAAIRHPRAHKIRPYADYFYRWQGYALIDLIRLSDCVMPIYATPDVVKRAKTILKTANFIRTHQAPAPATMLTAPNRWHRLAGPMTWLAHFRSFRDAVFQSYDTDQKQLRTRYKRGARELAKHLGVTGKKLEEALKNELLVLADTWIHANKLNDARSIWTRRAWPYLRQEIELAMSWLILLTGKPFSHYLDKWRSPHFGNAGWAALDEVLPYSFVEHEKKFIDIAPHYLPLDTRETGKRVQLENTQLVELCRRLRKQNSAFRGFLSAFHDLHDNLRPRSFEEHGIDFRELRPLDHYTMLAIHAEGCLRRELDTRGQLICIEPNQQTLAKYIETLGSARKISTRIMGTFSTNKALADLRKDRKDPIGRIQTIKCNLSEAERTLVQAFLCCLLARNYFAHHDFLDNELLNTDKSAFLLRGILLTVLTLLS